jgi:tripartite-type tricarboxylate transporter receptor subunit TctC
VERLASKQATVTVDGEEIMNRVPLAFITAFVLLTTLSADVSAQDYPAKPIRVIAASSAGGLSDIFIRAIGDELQKRWGQPLVIENRPGGSFNIAAKACVDAPPDGYTICIVPNEPLTYNPYLFKNLGFDPAKGLAPITNLFFITQVMAVNASLKAATLSELAALSKAKPATLSYSAPSLAHVLFVESFKRETGADMVRVPFKGGADAVNGMISGSTPIVFLGIGNVISFLREGLAIGLAVDSDKRSPLVPNVPTLHEAGYRGDMTRSYFGLLAPAATPPAAIAKLQKEIASIIGEPSFADKHLIQRGLEPVANSSDAFADYIRRDREVAERIVKASGLQPQ